MADHVYTPFVKVSDAEASSGHYVYLGSALVGFRPYDGTRDRQEIADEVTTELAEMLQERLGWPQFDPDAWNGGEEPLWQRK